MPAVKITQQIIPTLQAQGKNTIYWDTDLRGFGVKVTTSGHRSYIVQAHVQRGICKQRVKLNNCDRMTAKEAREEARKQLASMGLGIDPISQRRAVELASMTLRKALDDRIAVKALKLRVARDYRNMAERAFPDWLDRPISTITDQMAVDRHRALTLKSGPSDANYAMRVLSSAFGHARGQHGLKASNPVTRLREGRLFNRVKPRDEYVEPQELAVMLTTLRQMEADRQARDRAQQEAARAAGLTWAGWRGRNNGAAPQGPMLGYGGAADIIRVLLLTGFRLEEAQGLEWSAVCFSQRTITLTDNKASRTLRMPMCTALVALLQRRADELRQDGTLPRWVFPTTGESRYQNLSGVDMPALSARVSAATGKAFHVYAHKLRHTFATYLRAMGHSEWTVAALLNHSRQSTVTTIYAAPMTATMHTVVEEYQGYLERLLPSVAPALLAGGASGA
jgi:integrase